MALITLATTRHVSLTVLVVVANFLLLQEGLSAATRPGSTKAQAVRNILIAVASVICLLAAVGIMQLISRD